MLRPRQENVSSPTTRRKAEENYATDRETQSLKENRLSKSTDATNKLLQTKDVNQKPQSWQRSTTGKGNEKIALGSPKHKSQVSVFVDKENDAQSTPKSPSKTKTKPAVLRPLTPTKRPGNELSASTPKKSLGSTGKRSSERQPLEHGFQKEEELPYIPDDEVDLDLFDDRIAHDSYGQRSDDSYEEDTILVKPRKFQLDTIEENADLRWSGKADDVHDHLSEETNQASSETSVKERKPLTLDAISDPSVEELLAKMPSEVEYAPPKEQELPYVPDVEVEMPHFSGLLEPLVFDSTLFKNEDDSLSFDPTAEETMSAALDERSVSEFVLSVANAVEEDASSNDEQDDLDIPFDDFYFDINAALTVTA